MVSYALLFVFSRFALILMLASATNMWERRLDLKVYVFLLTIPWRCFFCGFFCYLYFVFVMLSCRLFIAVLWSLVCGDLLRFITSRWGVLGQMWYLSV